MHFVARFGIAAIGTTYRVHRATAARWIERALDKLASETYRLLGEQLRLSPVHASRTWRFTAEAIVLQALTVPQQPVAVA